MTQLEGELQDDDAAAAAAEVEVEANPDNYESALGKGGCLLAKWAPHPEDAGRGTDEQRLRC